MADSALQAPITKIIAKFEKANPKIKVKASFVSPGNPYIQALTTQIQGGNAPDVFYSSGGASSNGAASVLPLAKAGKLVDLSRQSWAGKVPSAARNLYYVNNKLYALPLYESPLAVEYNVTEFKKLGLSVPTTYSQFLGLCSKIKAAGKIPIGEPGQAASELPMELAASTVYSKDPNWNTQRASGSTTFAGTAGWQQAMADVVQMNKAGCFQPGAAGASVPTAFQLVGSGKALMFVGPVDALGAIQPLAKGAKFAAFPLPGTTAAQTTAMITYSDAIAISAQSKNQAADLKFVDYVASPAASALLASMSGTISLTQAARIKLPSQLSAFAPEYKAHRVTTYAPDAWPSGAPLTNALLPDGSGLFTGQQTPSSVLKAMDQEWSNSGLQR